MITRDTQGAVIHHTLNEVEPTEFEPIVTSGGIIRISRNAVLLEEIRIHLDKSCAGIPGS